MKDLTFKMWCKAQYAKQHIESHLAGEEGGADGIIIAIIIIIIVVALGIVFREQIGKWFNTLAEGANSEINQANSASYAPVS